MSPPVCPDAIAPAAVADATAVAAAAALRATGIDAGGGGEGAIEGAEGKALPPLPLPLLSPSLTVDPTMSDRVAARCCVDGTDALGKAADVVEDIRTSMGGILSFLQSLPTRSSSQSKLRERSSLASAASSVLESLCLAAAADDWGAHGLCLNSPGTSLVAVCMLTVPTQSTMFCEGFPEATDSTAGRLASAMWLGPGEGEWWRCGDGICGRGLSIAGTLSTTATSADVLPVTPNDRMDNRRGDGDARRSCAGDGVCCCCCFVAGDDDCGCCPNGTTTFPGIEADVMAIGTKLASSGAQLTDRLGTLLC